VKTKTIAKWLLIGVGTIALTLSFTAQWIGLDPNNGWGPRRSALLAIGCILLVLAVFMDFYRNLINKLLIAQKTGEIQYWLLLVLAFGLISTSYLYKASTPHFSEMIHRETQNASISRDFYQNGIDLLHPRDDTFPPPNNYLALDFPILEALVALIYKITGINDVVGKIVATLSFLGALVLFYLIILKLSKEKWLSLMTLAIAATSYNNIFFSATYMLEPFTLFWTMSVTYFAIRFIDERRRSDFIFTLISGIIVVLVKIFTLVPFGIAIVFYYCYQNRQKSAKEFMKKSVPLTVMVAIWLGFFAAWYMNVSYLEKSTSVLYMEATYTGFISKWPLTNGFAMIKNMIVDYTPILPVFLSMEIWLILIIIGGFSVRWNHTTEVNVFIIGALVGFAFIFVSINEAMDHNYYYQTLIYPLAFLSAVGLQTVFSWIFPLVNKLMTLLIEGFKTWKSYTLAATCLLVACTINWERDVKLIYEKFAGKNNQQFWTLGNTEFDRVFFWIVTIFLIVNLSMLFYQLYKSPNETTFATILPITFILIAGAMVHPVQLTERERFYDNINTWIPITYNKVLEAHATYLQNNMKENDITIIVNGRGNYYNELLYYANRKGYPWRFSDLYDYLYDYKGTEHTPNLSDRAKISKTDLKRVNTVFIEYTPVFILGPVIPKNLNELLQWIEDTDKFIVEDIYNAGFDPNAYIIKLKVKSK
jgi:hypothetical protein